MATLTVVIRIPLRKLSCYLQSGVVGEPLFRRIIRSYMVSGFACHNIVKKLSIPESGGDSAAIQRFAIKAD